MLKLVVTYKTPNDAFTSETEETYDTLREAQLAIENQWELDLENSDVWVEELSPEQREDLFPQKINETLFRCDKIPSYDYVEYQIVEG